MICQRCNQREAEIHIHSLTPNGPVEFHLCRECSGSLALKGELPGTSVEIPLGKLLEPLLQEFATAISAAKPEPQEEADEYDVLLCGACGAAWKDVRKGNGRLGCPACYDAFGAPLLPLLEKLHGATHHMGSRPEVLSEAAIAARRRSTRIASLRKELQALLSTEEYERAAEVRDELRLLEAEIPR